MVANGIRWNEWLDPSVCKRAFRWVCIQRKIKSKVEYFTECHGKTLHNCFIPCLFIQTRNNKLELKMNWNTQLTKTYNFEWAYCENSSFLTLPCPVSIQQPRKPLHILRYATGSISRIESFPAFITGLSFSRRKPDSVGRHFLFE